MDELLRRMAMGRYKILYIFK